MLFRSGVGTSSNHFETDVASLSASVKTDGLFITEADDLSITKLSAISVNRIGTDASVESTETDAAQEDLTSTGALVLSLTSGTLTVEGGDDNAGISSAGETLLKAADTGNDITLNASIATSSGNLSLDAADDIELNSNGDISLSTDSKTIDMKAGGDITAADGNTVSTTNGDVWMEATTNITVESISVGTGGVYLKAGTDIIDGDGDNDVTAADLILEAGSGIGSTTDLLDITVTNLTATADADGIFIAESDGVVIGSMSVTANRVDTTASTATTDTSKTQEDLTTANDGAIILTATDITLGGGADSTGLSAAGAGNVLLQASTDGITINADIDGGSGHITILATTATDGVLTQDADITTTSTGTIDIEADSITFNDGKTTSTGSGNIRYKATNAMTIGDISTSGDVSLIAASITDSGTTDTDVTADELRINVTGTGGVGTSSNHFETAVATLSADVKTDGLFITEADSLIIDKLNAIAVNRIGTDGTVESTETDAAQEIGRAHV